MTCEGNVVTNGKAGCDAGDGDIVATMVDSLSSFLSKSRILFGGWPSLLDLAGRRRATCSTHSTLAFWHLRTCHPEWSLHISRETYLWQIPAVSEGTHRTLCFLHLSQANALPILPSLASIVRMELMFLGDLGDSRSVPAGCCIVGKSEQMPRSSCRGSGVN